MRNAGFLTTRLIYEQTASSCVTFCEMIGIINVYALCNQEMVCISICFNISVRSEISVLNYWSGEPGLGPGLLKLETEVPSP